MSSREECLKNAEECLQWARAARTDDKRKAFLDMARTWTQAADLAGSASANAAQTAAKPAESKADGG